MRIDVRLDDERSAKLKQLQSMTRLSASEIVKRAIDLLHRQQVRRSRERLDALLSRRLHRLCRRAGGSSEPVQAVSDAGSRGQAWFWLIQDLGSL